jgi:hypothetical protein
MRPSPMAKEGWSMCGSFLIILIKAYFHEGWYVQQDATFDRIV